MKTLKKNPLVQRMEDMRFASWRGVDQNEKPINGTVSYSNKLHRKEKTRVIQGKIKTVHSPVFVRIGNKIKKCKVKLGGVKGSNIIKDGNEGPQVDIFLDKNGVKHTFVDGVEQKEKIIWEGGEWLRSINCEHYGWHLLAKVALVGSIIYFVVKVL